MAGTKSTSIKSYIFYSEGNVSNSNNFADLPLTFMDGTTNFLSQSVLLANDSANSIQFSFDGTNVHGTAKTNEKVTFDFMKFKKIWLRSSVSSAYRFWAW